MSAVPEGYDERRRELVNAAPEGCAERRRRFVSAAPVHMKGLLKGRGDL